MRRRALPVASFVDLDRRRPSPQVAVSAPTQCGTGPYMRDSRLSTATAPFVFHAGTDKTSDAVLDGAPHPTSVALQHCLGEGVQSAMIGTYASSRTVSRQASIDADQPTGIETLP